MTFMAEEHFHPWTFSVDFGVREKNDAVVCFLGSLKATLERKGVLPPQEGVTISYLPQQLDRVSPYLQKLARSIWKAASTLRERAAAVKQFVITHSGSVLSSSSMSDASSLQPCSHEESRRQDHHPHQ